MARKNIFETSGNQETPSSEAADTISDARPLANFSRPQKRSSPIGAFSSSLGSVSEKAQRVEELEEQLRAGQTIVELDPALIDSSFVVDRLSVSDEDEESLVQQIREHGQKVPILVRPHPEIEDRFQVAYGHRRLAAVKRLGIKIRAVVRELSDDELVVNQGQENNARTNLSFIERAYFAFRLEKRKFSRDVIISALGVDKAALSRMIALIDRLPDDVIEAIGAAPDFGRVRWNELADLLEDGKKRKKVAKLITDPSFLEQPSNDRFLAVHSAVRHVAEKPRVVVWESSSGEKPVRIRENEKKLSLSFDKATDRGFGAFIESQLDSLYSDYIKKQQSEDE